MKVIILALIASLAIASALPQIERGSIFAPSGMFDMTVDWAAPPVDLSQPIVLLPIATPITEEPQEPKLTPRPTTSTAKPTATPSPTTTTSTKPTVPPSPTTTTTTKPTSTPRPTTTTTTKPTVKA